MWINAKFNHNSNNPKAFSKKSVIWSRGGTIPTATDFPGLHRLCVHEQRPSAEHSAPLRPMQGGAGAPLGLSRGRGMSCLESICEISSGQESPNLAARTKSMSADGGKQLRPDAGHLSGGAAAARPLRRRRCQGSIDRYIVISDTAA